MSVTKRRRRFTMRQVIRADLELLADRRQTSRGPRCRAASRSAREPSRAKRKPRNSKPFRRRRRSRPGRGQAEGQGRAIRCLPPAPGSLCSTPFCAPTRPPPARCAPASRCRAPRPRAKILRLNADEAALRDLRFAVGDPLGPAANLLSLWRDGAGRPPSLDPGRILDAAARLDLAVDPNGLAASLKACAGEGDPVSAAAKAAALAFSALPDAPPAEAEILALWVFDMVIAHPAALAAARAADRHEASRPRPALAGRRPTAKAGRPSLAKRRRRRDRARRRLRPRPRRRSLPAARTP